MSTTSISQPDVQPFRFLDLPKEIRLCVYDQLPVTTNHVTFPRDNVESKDQASLLVVKTMPVAILATCRQINSEASSIVGKKLQKICNEAPRMIINAGAEVIYKSYPCCNGMGDGRRLVERVTSMFPKCLPWGHPEDVCSNLGSLGLHIPAGTKPSHYRLLWKFLAHAYRRYSLRTDTMYSPVLQVAVAGLESNISSWNTNLFFGVDQADEDTLHNMKALHLERAILLCRRLYNYAAGNGRIEFFPTYNEYLAAECPEQVRIDEAFITKSFARNWTISHSEHVWIHPVISAATWLDEWEEGVQFAS